ncbi:hypothetical protein FOL47_001937, partial [Perkinsus chesapeaki]
VQIDESIFEGEHFFDKQLTPRVDLNLSIKVAELDESELRRRGEREAMVQEILDALRKWRRPLSRPASYTDVVKKHSVDNEAARRSSLPWETKIELPEERKIPPRLSEISDNIAGEASEFSYTSPGHPDHIGKGMELAESEVAREKTELVAEVEKKNKGRMRKKRKEKRLKDPVEEVKAFEQLIVQWRRKLRQERLRKWRPLPPRVQKKQTNELLPPAEKVRLKASLPGHVQHEQRQDVASIDDEISGMLRYSAATMEVRQYYTKCLQTIGDKIAKENELIMPRLRANRPPNRDHKYHDRFVQGVTDDWASADLLKRRLTHLNDWSAL